MHILARMRIKMVKEVGECRSRQQHRDSACNTKESHLGSVIDDSFTQNREGRNEITRRLCVPNASAILFELQLSKRHSEAPRFHQRGEESSSRMSLALRARLY